MPEHQQIQKSKKSDTISQKQAPPVIQMPASNPYSIIQRAKINPKSLTHADIMQLQRTIGNQAVGRLLLSIGSSSTAQQETVQRQEIPEEEEPLQGKMIETIQRQEIPEEEEPLQGKLIEPIQRQEIPEEEEPLQGKMIETVQRQEVPEEEEPLQGKFENKSNQMSCPSCFVTPIVQKQEIPEEEEPLQGKFESIQCQEISEGELLQGKMAETIQRQEQEEEPLETKRENNTGMPDNLKAGVENLSGIDMSDVRVHYNSDKPAHVGAHAYTQGTNIYVAPGQGKYLSHETWHVVQQKQGRVKPTLQLKDETLINDNSELEHEADVRGESASILGQQGRVVRQTHGLRRTNFKERESKHMFNDEMKQHTIQLGATMRGLKSLYRSSRRGGRRKRIPGDATYLALLRFTSGVHGKCRRNLTRKKALEEAEKKKGCLFKDWKGSKAMGTLQEAQHLMPASVAATVFNWPDHMINSEHNAKMLLAGRKGAGGTTSKEYDDAKIKRTTTAVAKMKGKKHHLTSKLNFWRLPARGLLHIKKGIAHPLYNKFAEREGKKYYDSHKILYTQELTKEQFIELTDILRQMHKRFDRTNTTESVDDM